MGEQNFTYNEADSIVAVLLDSLSARIHEVSKEKGFHDTDRSLPHTVGMVVTELAEMIEVERAGQAGARSDKIPDHTKLEEEVADAIIRLLDLAGKLGLKVGGAVVAKHAYNQGRPHRHGKAY